MYVIARQLWGTTLPRGAAAARRRGRPARDDPPRAGRGLASDHGTPETLVADARATVDEIKAFIAEQDILRLPEPDRCRIIEMPEFQRGNSAAYLNPAPPLDPAGSSEYAVSPPPADWDAGAGRELPAANTTGRCSRS